jgi:hypothetical protein
MFRISGAQMEKRPQFQKMNPGREENPPPRDLGCPEYRNCLTLAAHRNYCLDCSACECPEASAPAPAPTHAR